MDLGTVIAIILSELETGQNENNKVKKVICFLRHNAAHWYNVRRSRRYFFCKLKGAALLSELWSTAGRVLPQRICAWSNRCPMVTESGSSQCNAGRPS